MTNVVDPDRPHLAGSGSATLQNLNSGLHNTGTVASENDFLLSS
jgi:hypothetical protein